MTVRLGADATSTSVSALRALGATFVCRYLSPASVGAWKNLSEAEANALKAGGIDIVSNWEVDTNDWEGGRSQGVNYAQQAAALHTACGGPGAAPIYFSVDMDADPASVVNSGYFQGINSVIGVKRTGCYGSTAVIAALTTAGLLGNLGAPLGWRTMSTDFQGGAGSESQFSLEQTGYFNNDYDRDASLVDNFGQWSANGGSAPAPTPAPAPVPVNNSGYETNAHHNTHTPLTVDGYFGSNSWEALQFVLGVTVDGIPGPQTYTALQTMLSAYHGTALAHDGVLTPGGNTVKSVQEKAGCTQDGYWGAGTSSAVQAALNAGTFWGNN